MTQTKQKQSVVDAVAAVLGDSFAPGETVVRDSITKEQKEKIRDTVLNGIMEGSIGYDKSTDDPKEVKRYVNSMVDNHLRKARELNGGNIYKPEKTGTKRDPQLRELNKLLRSGKFNEGSEQHTQIVEHIGLREKELETLRAQKKTAASISDINADVLPPHLQALANSLSETPETDPAE